MRRDKKEESIAESAKYRKAEQEEKPRGKASKKLKRKMKGELERLQMRERGKERRGEGKIKRGRGKTERE